MSGHRDLINEVLARVGIAPNQNDLIRNLTNEGVALLDARQRVTPGLRAPVEEVVDQFAEHMSPAVRVMFIDAIRTYEEVPS